MLGLGAVKLSAPFDDPNARSGKPLPVYGDGHCRATRTMLKWGRMGKTHNIG